MSKLNRCKIIVLLGAFYALGAIGSPAQTFDHTGRAKASAGLLSGTSGKLLSDNFILWIASSSLLNNLAAAWDGGTPGFVAAKTTFTGRTGLQMSGLTQTNTLTGLQSLAAFGAPYTVTVQVTPIEGTANPFAIFLVNADLSQYLILYANVNTAYGFEGFWVNAPSIASIGCCLGEQFSPNFVPQFKTLYQVVMQVDSTGVGTVEVYAAGTLLGTLSNLQAGTGPFYLVVGQAIGEFNEGGPQVVDWSSVEVTTP
jgi:hypothetical protein